MLAVDPSVSGAAAAAQGFITDNGPVLVGVIVAFSLFHLALMWVKRVFSGDIAGGGSGQDWSDPHGRDALDNARNSGF